MLNWSEFIKIAGGGSTGAIERNRHLRQNRNRPKPVTPAPAPSGQTPSSPTTAPAPPKAPSSGPSLSGALGVPVIGKDQGWGGQKKENTGFQFKGNKPAYPTTEPTVENAKGLGAAFPAGTTSTPAVPNTPYSAPSSPEALPSTFGNAEGTIGLNGAYGSKQQPPAQSTAQPPAQQAMSQPAPKPSPVQADQNPVQQPAQQPAPVQTQQQEATPAQSPAATMQQSAQSVADEQPAPAQTSPGVTAAADGFTLAGLGRLGKPLDGQQIRGMYDEAKGAWRSMQKLYRIQQLGGARNPQDMTNAEDALAEFNANYSRLKEFAAQGDVQAQQELAQLDRYLGVTGAAGAQGAPVNRNTLLAAPAQGSPAQNAPAPVAQQPARKGMLAKDNPLYQSMSPEDKTNFWTNEIQQEIASGRLSREHIAQAEYLFANGADAVTIHTAAGPVSIDRRAFLKLMQNEDTAKALARQDAVADRRKRQDIRFLEDVRDTPLYGKNNTYENRIRQIRSAVMAELKRMERVPGYVPNPNARWRRDAYNLQSQMREQGLDTTELDNLMSQLP